MILRQQIDITDITDKLKIQALQDLIISGWLISDWSLIDYRGEKFCRIILTKKYTLNE